MNSTKFLKRWIKASYVKIFRSLLEQGFDLFVEGEDRLTSAKTQFMECRIDGPYVSPCGTRGEMRAYIEVNLLGNTTRDERNIYNRENLQGLMAHMLNQDFCVYRTGNQGKEAADDGSLVGVMRLLPVDIIKTSDFGMIDSNTEVYQSVAEAHYEMYYTE